MKAKQIKLHFFCQHSKSYNIIAIYCDVTFIFWGIIFAKHEKFAITIQSQDTQIAGEVGATCFRVKGFEFCTVTCMDYHKFKLWENTVPNPRPDILVVTNISTNKNLQTIYIVWSWNIFDLHEYNTVILILSRNQEW